MGVMMSRRDPRAEWLVEPGFGEVADLFARQLAATEGFGAQLSVLHRGRPVIDAWGGEDFGRDSLVAVFSCTKGMAAIALALLLQRGQLDLDQRVAHYWPEFAQAGKAAVTVRQLLSHQAGIPEVDGNLSLDELLDEPRAAARLAAQHPLWAPGSAFGYHALAIGPLVSELCRRITGDSVQGLFEDEIRAPLRLEAWMGLPAELTPRVVPIRDALPAEPGAVLGPVSPLLEFVARPLIVDGGARRLGNDPAVWAAGPAAAGGVASARGLSGLYSAVLGGDSRPGLLTAETIDRISQVQSWGIDIVVELPMRFAILFQKPHAQRPWGGPRAFGHDGAAGALGFADPDSGLAFGFTTNRPAPALGDPRALALAELLRRTAARDE